MGRKDEVPAIKDLLVSVTSRLGLGGAHETAVIWRRWRDIVGHEVAEHAEPTSLREGVLRVRTETPVWATEIGYLREDIRRHINATVGAEAVKEIRVWTGGGKFGKGHAETRSGRRDAVADRTRPTDPETALERARRAWEQRRGR